MKITLSIIITTYKRENLLKRCLDSILFQIDKKNIFFEVLIIDDEKSKKIQNLVKNFSNNFNYLKKNKPPFNNKGVSNSRNLGILNSKGNYLLFLDDDDFLVQGSLQKIYEIIYQNLNISFFWFSNIYYYGKDYKISKNNKNLDNLLVKNFIPVGSYIIKKEFIKSFFNTEVNTHEDWLFLLENVLNLKSLFIPEIISVVDKTTSESLMKQEFTSFFNDFKYIYNKVLVDNEEIENMRKRKLDFLLKNYGGDGET